MASKMPLRRGGLNSPAVLRARLSPIPTTRRLIARCESTSTPPPPVGPRSRIPPRPSPPPRRRGRFFGLVFVAALGATAYGVVYPALITGPPPEPARPRPAEAVFEWERSPAAASKAASVEEQRDLLSSQHLQVRRSWERPGVYAWGSNAGRVVAPDGPAGEAVVKTPRRIAFFDGMLLRDLKLDRDFGVAVAENGDLIQWGTAFDPEASTPTPTLKGRDIAKVAVSRDRIVALSRAGAVYSLPVSRRDQQAGEKTAEKPPSTGGWFPFWSSSSSPHLFSSLHYRTITPGNLAWGEKVVDVAAGREHCVLLTSSGRVYTAAASSDAYPARGQLGVPGLTWRTRPADKPFDAPHELTTLRGFRAAQIAAGDAHSLVLDDAGRVFAFGDNASGQLGLPASPEATFVDAPALVAPFDQLYPAAARPTVAAVAAGGQNSFFAVEATATDGAGSAPPKKTAAVADLWACGQGIYGTLGTGKWTHVSAGPTKIRALSGLTEYDEAAGAVVPIRLASLAVGATHAAAVMANATSVAADKRNNNKKKGSSAAAENDTNWGADVLWWGGNEFYQLGTGKRNNVATPTYIGPLDGGATDAEMGRAGEAHRFQITPRKTVRIGPDGKGRSVGVEQRVECGRFVSAVYSAT